MVEVLIGLIIGGILVWLLLRRGDAGSGDKSILLLQEQPSRVEKLGRHLGNHDQFMGKLGNSLNTTVNHYNRAHKELGKVDKDVLRITDRSVGIEPISVEKPTCNDTDN